MSKPKPPCLGCPDRSINCHINCERYKAYREANIELVRTIRQARREEAIADALIVRGIQISKKRRNEQ